MKSPYPEEFNRQAIGLTASLHFAPTQKAADALLKEGKDPEQIFVTGNTGIDALHYTVRNDFYHPETEWAKGSRLIAVTAHRRENLGEPMRDMFRAIRRIVEEFTDVKVIYPVHLNPQVRKIADEEFGGCDRIHLIEPLDVVEFHNLMKASYLIMTDSGGIQEEAPALGKPVLVMRDTTERPEGVEAGTLKLAGTKMEDIYRECRQLLTEPEKRNRCPAEMAGNSLDRRKKWILENQGPEGEFYMNGSKAGDVNPYFACMAALGLLAETKNCPITETEKKAVGRYLDWHTGILLETDGKMGIYRKESGKLIYKEKADSEDGYLGMYLFLMGKYLEKTESTDLPEYWKKGISLALKKIQSLMQDGITQVSEENTTVYLMDNLEVWKGLYELEHAGLKDVQAIREMRNKLQAQIEKLFWDDANQRWRIIENSDLYHQKEFYPDGVAQIYPLIYEFPVKEKKKQKILYEQFTERFQWQKLNKKRNGFL